MTVDLEQTATPCAATDCTRPAAPVLCAVDERRVGEALAGIQSEYELLSAAPSMQGREVGTIGGSKLASQRSPGNLQVIVLRDPRRADAADPWGVDNTPSVFATLAYYAELVREGRDLVQPVHHVDACRYPCMHRACLLGVGHAVPVPLTVASERKLLATHLGWIVAQDWAGEFCDEIRGLHAVLRRANGHVDDTRRLRRLHIACPDCGVRAVTYRPGDGQACCENCGTCRVLAEDAA